MTCKAFKMVCISQCADELPCQAFTALATNLAPTSRLLSRGVLLLWVCWVGKGARRRAVALVRRQRLRTLHVVRVRWLPREAIHAWVIGLILRLLRRLLLRGILASQRRRAVAGSAHGGVRPVLGVYAAVTIRTQSGGGLQAAQAAAASSVERRAGHVGRGDACDNDEYRWLQGVEGAESTAVDGEGGLGRHSSGAVATGGGRGAGGVADPCPAVKVGQRCLGQHRHCWDGGGRWLRRSVGSMRRSRGGRGSERRRRNGEEEVWLVGASRDPGGG